MKIAVVVQARVDSQRLYRKTLLPLGDSDSTVLDQVIKRLSWFIPVENIVIATTTSPKDKDIVELCQKKSYRYFCGEENDVLDRYYKTACDLELEHIIRICADSPLIDPDLLTEMYQSYQKMNVDYLSNTLENTYPEGLNAEFFTFQALKTAWQKATLPSEREHVTPYIKKSDQFNKYSYCSLKPMPQYRWTLDYPQDYELITQVYQKLGHKTPYFTTQDIYELLAQDPPLSCINANIPRNEGYLLSLQKDQAYAK